MRFNVGDIIESVDGTISTVVYVKDWKIISLINKSSNLLNFNFNGDETNNSLKNVFRVISKDRPLEPDVDNNNLFVSREFFYIGNYLDVLFNDVYAGVYNKNLLLYKTEKCVPMYTKKLRLMGKIK